MVRSNKKIEYGKITITNEATCFNLNAIVYLEWKLKNDNKNNR